MTPLEVEMAEALRWMIEEYGVDNGHNGAALDHAWEVLERFHHIHLLQTKELNATDKTSNQTTGVNPTEDPRQLYLFPPDDNPPLF